MDMKVEQPTLQGERLTLRPLSQSDTGLIELYAGDERVARNLSRVPHPYPPGAAEAFVENILSGETNETVWAIVLSNGEHSEMVGLISLKANEDNRAVIGYWIAAQLWGAGYGTEAATLIVEYARDIGLDALEAHVLQPNERSAKILTKAGFGYVGDSEQHSVFYGRMVATWDYQLAL